MLNVDELIDLIQTQATPWTINILSAILVFVFGRIVSRYLLRLYKRLMARTDFDPMLIDFFESILRAVLLIIVVVASLDQLGVNTASMIAVLGAAGLAIGLALQGSLQNFAAGIMMLIFRPFRQGDYIEAGGTAGTVEKITVFSTVMTSPDNKEIIVPNGNIYKDNIVNYSARDTRRIDLVFSISYESDVDRAKEILLKMVSDDDRVLEYPPIRVAVAELADSSVNIMVRPWVKTSDFWDARIEFIDRAKTVLESKGIDIPYPQIKVHLPVADSADDHDS